MAAITFERVSKIYPSGLEAVHEVDLAVADGEFMVLVGPSGCGKTTLLRMVAGLEEITSGTLRLDDRVVNDVAPKDRDIAMVFQSYALYPHMTVGENIGFSLAVKKVARKTREAKVKETAAILGLADLLDRKPAELSGGQRQRVAMGRAIVREPSVFLMDEPLSNLDARLRVEMRAEVSRIQKSIGVATLYVTHDQTEAITMGDRVAVIRHGVVQQCDTPVEIYDHPSNLFVASFIGSPSMNLYEAAVDDDGLGVRVGDGRLALPNAVLNMHPGLESRRGRSVVLGFRPEYAALASGQSSCLLSCHADMVETLGAENLVHFRVDAPRVHPDGTTDDPSSSFVRAGEGVVRLDRRLAVSPGDRLTLALAPDRLSFFDRETGVAI
jgi:multiple sugar transport system ATP-binding protein